MYYKINPSDLAISTIDLRTNQPPQIQYSSGYVEDSVISLTSGRNTLNQKFREKIKIEVGDLTTNGNLRGGSIFISFTDEKVNPAKTEEKVKPVIGLMIGDTESTIKLDTVLIQKLFKRGPDFFINLVCAIEEHYAKDERIKHTPWLRNFFNEISNGVLFDTWKNFAVKTGLIMP